MVSASCEGFDRQMRFVKEHFDVITFTHLKDFQDGKRPLPKRPIIITFDDGFSDNYLNAFPILNKYQIPATIFLSTGYIGTDQIFWWEKVVYWFKHADNFFKVWQGLGHPLPQAQDQTRSWTLKYLKDAQDTVRVSCIAGMEKEFPPIQGENLLSFVRGLRWEEVLEMTRSGIEFGSHSVTHPILSKLSKHALLFEVQASKKEIEAQTGKPVIAFAYPNGSPESFTQETVDMLREADYQFGVTYYPSGVNRIENMDPYRLKRVSVGRDDSFDHFRSRLLLPMLFLRKG